jgi:hypothetical protein
VPSPYGFNSPRNSVVSAFVNNGHTVIDWSNWNNVKLIWKCGDHVQSDGYTPYLSIGHDTTS